MRAPRDLLWAPAMRSGARFNSVYRLTPAEGGTRWVEAEGQCTLNADGTPLRFSGFSFDVTERRTTRACM